MTLSFAIGDTTIHRIIEQTLPFELPTAFLPALSPELLAANAGWMAPADLDPATGKLILCIQSYVVRTPHFTVLVDTCVGNDKPRDVFPIWHMLQTGFLADLEAAGYPPATIDTVLCTHLHLDHVGAIKDFPNAELVVAREEFDAFLTQPRFPGYRRQDLVSAGRIRIVDLKEDPRFGFPGSFDLFGDSEIVLLDAKGHTRGTLAVAIDDGKRPYIHIGDAAYQSWEYGLAPSGPSRLAKLTAWNESALHETYRVLREAENHERRPILVPAHDIDVYATLPHDPKA